ncbi:MAG: hypothetical protein QG607_70 [Patescibacteria group bacterium]|nr:hypothetical protein [Patescibacteria group bacterium]
MKLIEEYLDAQRKVREAQSDLLGAETKLDRCEKALLQISEKRESTGDLLWDTILWDRALNKDLDAAIKNHAACKELLNQLLRTPLRVVIFAQTRATSTSNISNRRFSLLPPQSSEVFGFWIVKEAGPQKWSTPGSTEQGIDYVIDSAKINLGVQPNKIGAALRVNQGQWKDAHPQLVNLHGSPDTYLTPTEIFERQQGRIITVQDNSAACEWKQFCVTCGEWQRLLDNHPHATEVRRVYYEACELINTRAAQKEETTTPPA